MMRPTSSTAYGFFKTICPLDLGSARTLALYQAAIDLLALVGTDAAVAALRATADFLEQQKGKLGGRG